MKCLNCNFELIETNIFCPNCGQKINDKLTLGVMFRNTIGNYFSFDSKFFHSILPLLFRPGFLAKKYIEGKRTRYMHPAQFYLFFSILFFFLFSFVTKQSEMDLDMAVQKGFDETSPLADSSYFDDTTLDSITNINLNQLLNDSLAIDTNKVISNNTSKFNNNTFSINSDEPNKSGILNLFNNENYNSDKLDSLIKNNGTEEEKLAAVGYKEGDSKFDKFIAQKTIRFQTKKGSGILETLYNNIPFSLFLLLPLFALLLKLLYFKKGPISHHLVYSFFYFVFVFAILSFFLIANFFVSFPTSYYLIPVSLSFVYLWLGNYKFYKTGITGSFFKTIFLLVISTFIIVPISALFILLLSVLTY